MATKKQAPKKPAKKPADDGKVVTPNGGVGPFRPK